MDPPAKSRLTAVWIFLAAALGAWLFFNAPILRHKEPALKKVYPLCQGPDAAEVKDGLIERTEDAGSVVYVIDSVWSRTPGAEKENVGYFLALCRSEKERVEIRSAETGDLLQKYVIDLHYKMTHGLK